jgi:hypothetical protein
MLLGLGSTNANAPVQTTDIFQWLMYGVGALFLWSAVRSARRK